MRKRLLIAVLMPVVAFPLPAAIAWGPAGHKIIASIAFRRLAPGKQATIIALLKQHPRFDEDFAKKMPPDLPAGDANDWIVQQAAIWPDLARGLKGPGLRQEYHHRSWHFIDLPDFLTPADEQALKDQVKNRINLSFDVPSDPDAQKSMNIMQAISHSRSIVLDPHAKPQERALHLSWLIHLVGDLHQPLHTTALFSRRLFPEGDQGGNKIPTEQRKNLHGLWDGFPGSPWNYGLVLNAKSPAQSFEIVRREGPLAEQPFTAKTTPIELRAKARKIPAWTMDRTGLVGLLQQSPARSDEPAETITLIPMGAARLRISAFPTASERPDAHTWVAPTDAGTTQ